MKIYLLPVETQVPSRINPFVAHSQGFNIEVGFVNYLKQSGLLTQNPNEADWHYLPFIWSFWTLSHNYGVEGRKELQKYLDKVILDDKKTFTVSEADNEPGFEIGETKVFSGNQSIGFHGHKWIPAPIITLPHEVPAVLPEKKYLSNFVGNTKAWETRIKMVELLKDRKDIKIVYGKRAQSLFVQTILESYSTLCPRGSALGSYRFYESMQLGVVPIMISDEDFRPFPDKIDWETCSFFTDDVNELPELLDSLQTHELGIMGKNSEFIWLRLFNHWPEYILESL